MAITRTVNFRLPIPDAGKTPWQSYYSELATVVDSVLGRFVAIGGFRGAWTNSTSFSVDQKLVDTVNGTVYQCVVAHTSAASPTTFAQDRAARPTLWTTWSSTGTSSGVWIANRGYAVNEFVASGAKWAVCVLAHTSTSSFDNDVISGYWSVLVDLSAYSTVTFPITMVQGGTGSTTAADFRFNFDLEPGVDVQAYSSNLANLAAQPDVASLIALNAINTTNLSTIAGYSSLANLTTLISYAAMTNLTAVVAATAAGMALLDDANAAAQRTTLGLGTAAVKNTGTSADNIVLLDGSAKLPAVDGSQLTNLASIPAGIIVPCGNATEPSGWLFCYGQAISRATYSTLFTAISTTYGVGDGATTFNVPDLRGRVVAGQDDMGGSSANRLTGTTGSLNGDTLGATGGAETHTLDTTQIPAHTHTIGGAGAGSAPVGDTGGGTSSGSTGGGLAHNNVQPTIILNYIIKT